MALLHVEGLAESDGVVFKTIPAAKYPMRIVGVEDTVSGPKSKVPGSPMLKVKAKVEEGNTGEGTTMYMNIMLPTQEMDFDIKQKAIDRIKRLLIACGITESVNEFDTADLMGKSFQGVVSLKTEAGISSNNIVDQLPMNS
jgi:hypothetical protein